MKLYPIFIALILTLTAGLSILSNNIEALKDPYESFSNTFNNYHNKERTINELKSNYFIENIGQIPENDYLFYSSTGDFHFLSDGVIMRFRDLEPNLDEEEEPFLHALNKSNPPLFHESGVVLKYSFLEANEAIPYGRDRCSWNNNYFKGSDQDGWFTDVPNYKEIVYPNIWDGIDIVYRLKEGNIKYDIVVSAGADPDQIQFRIDGAEDLLIDGNKELVVRTEFCDIFDSDLVAFYDDLNSEEVDVEFKMIHNNQFGFNLFDYDGSRRIVIDPLIYSTLLGGSSGELGEEIEIDNEGNAYIVGTTHFSTSDYPTTIGSYDYVREKSDEDDVFISKLNSEGDSLIYSTFIGGQGQDYGKSIALDSNGNAYITGYTHTSSSDGYPTVNGSYDKTFNGGYTDVFVTKINSRGSSLIYSTFLGGLDSDYGSDIEVDSDGNAYITGWTGGSESILFPTTNGSFDPTHNGGPEKTPYDVFVTKLDPKGESIVYSTFIGGSGSDEGHDIEVDEEGNIYVTGWTTDALIDYPTTTGSYNEAHNGGKESLRGECDVFITKLNSDGSSLIYSTFLGGPGNDFGFDIEIDDKGNSYITGSCDNGFPFTNSSVNLIKESSTHLFVSKMDDSGSTLINSIMISDASGNDIELDASQNIYVTGRCGEGFPVTNGVFDITFNDIQDDHLKADAFLIKINNNGSVLLYSTFLGGSNDDWGKDMKIIKNNNVIIMGKTISKSVSFPTTDESYDTTYNGRVDLFITNFYMNPKPPIFYEDLTPNSTKIGQKLNFTLDMENKGISEVIVEYWYGRGNHTNATMSFNDHYFHSIDIGDHDSKELNYIFHASNYFATWNNTLKKNITIIDDDVINNSSDKGKDVSIMNYIILVIIILFVILIIILISFLFYNKKKSKKGE